MSGDVVSIVLAAFAVALAAAVAVLMYASPHHGIRLRRATPTSPHPIGVRLVPSTGTGLGYWWQFMTAADAPAASVDILNFRTRTSGPDGPWQHELMEAAIELAPAEPAYLRAPALATAGVVYEVSIGWTFYGADTDRQGSSILIVEPEPYI